MDVNGTEEQVPVENIILENGAVYQHSDGIYPLQYISDAAMQDEEMNHVQEMEHGQYGIQVVDDSKEANEMGAHGSRGLLDMDAVNFKRRRSQIGVCKICNKKFTNLTQHMYIHDENRQRKYPCTLCDKTFFSKHNLSFHMETHPIPKPHKCPDCDKSFHFRMCLKAHKRNLHSGAHLCNECGRILKSYNSLMRHLETHSTERKFECDICGNKFKYQHVLNDHRRIHTGEKPWSCGICGMSFRQRSGMKIHERDVHSSEKTFRCDLCAAAFVNKNYLQRHMVRIHTKARAQFGPCSFCKKYFSTSYSLKKHMVRHNGNEPCPICGKTFPTKKKTEKHMRFYVGRKPFRCGHCDRLFHTSKEARRHIMNHVAEDRKREQEVPELSKSDGKLTVEIFADIGDTSDEDEEGGADFSSIDVDKLRGMAHFFIQNLGDLDSEEELPMESGQENFSIPQLFPETMQRESQEADPTGTELIPIQGIQRQSQESEPIADLGLIPIEEMQSQSQEVEHNADTEASGNAIAEVDYVADEGRSEVTESEKGGLNHATGLDYGSENHNKLILTAITNSGYNTTSNPTAQEHATTEAMEALKQFSHSEGMIGNPVFSSEYAPQETNSNNIWPGQDESNQISSTSIFDVSEEQRKEICETCGKATKNMRAHLRYHRKNPVDRPREICETCGKAVKNLQTHERIHKQAPVRCDICGKTLCGKWSLINHLRLHGEAVPLFKCTICGKKYTTKFGLTFHMNIHTGKGFQCQYCLKKFAWRGSLIAHIRTHTREKPYPCRICGRKFSHMNARVDHERIHTGERPHVCDVCGKGFTQRSSLRSHLHTHSKEKKFECEICGKKFARKGGYRQHLKRHEEREKFKCEICDCDYFEPYALKKHMLWHGKFSCSSCRRRFSTKEELMKHELKFKDSQPTSCGVCDRKFHSKSSARRHMTTHTGRDKTFKCPACEKQFSTKENLSEHEAEFAGQKPFSCAYCKKMFHSKEVASTHVMSHVKRVREEND